MNKRFFFFLPVAITLFSVIAGTIASAQLSVPGDPLYGIKTKTQEVYVGLAVTDAMRAQAALSIAESKLREMQELEREGPDSPNYSQAEAQLAKNLAIASSSIASGNRSGKNIQGLMNALKRVNADHSGAKEKGKATTTKEKKEKEAE